MIEAPNWPSLYAKYISEVNNFPTEVQWARKKETDEIISKLAKGPESECGEDMYLLNGFCLVLDCPKDPNPLSLVIQGCPYTKIP